MSLWFFLSLVAIALCTCTNNFYNYDGSCNNNAHPNAGLSEAPYRREQAAEPGDELISWGDPTQEYKLYSDRPNERTVSNTIIATLAVVPNDRHINLIAMQYGQLLTHDLSKALRPADNRSNINITDPTDDFLFLNDGTPKIGIGSAPNAVIGNRRSGGENRNGIFEPWNEASGWLDAHFIYGTNADNNTAVRGPKVDGRIWTPDMVLDYSRVLGFPVNSGHAIYTEKNLLPVLTQTGLPLDIANTGQNASFIFSAGDTRVSENILLTSLQTVWAREHNRNAAQVKAKNPTWTDEQIFQKARVLTVATYQHVTFSEYLPTVWGRLNYALYVGPYRGYRANVDGSTGITFATAAMRAGHSTVKQNITLWTSCRQLNLSLCFNGTLVQGAQPGSGPFAAGAAELYGLCGGPSAILQGAAYEKAENGDIQVVDTLRNIRINANFVTGVDVSAANIRRGRIHSIPNYYTLRKQYHPLLGREIYGTLGCLATETSPSPDPIGCFTRFAANTTVATKLRALYGKINKIDAYVGILAEAKVIADSNFGPTGTAIVLEQFRLSRDGDRFYYENLPESLLSRAEKRTVEETTFAQIIKRNSFVTTLNDNAFLTPEVPRSCGAHH